MRSSYPDLQRAFASTVRVAALEATGLLDSAPEEAFDQVTALVRRCLGVPVALVSIVASDRQFFKSQQGLGEPWCSDRQTPLSHSFCQYVAIDDEPLIVEDAREHPILKFNGAVADLNVVAYLGVPLRTPDGHAIGSLCAIDSAPRAWSDADRGALEALADAAMHLIAQRYAPADERAQPPSAPFCALAESLSHPVALLDRTGVVLHANPGAIKLAGLPPGAVIGHPAWDALPLYDEAETRLRKAVAQAASGAEVRYHESDVDDGQREADFLLAPADASGGRLVLQAF